MSDKFNENLSMFLTSCRESALQQLKENNPEHKQLYSEAIEILIEIKSELPASQEALIDKLLENHNRRFGMEINCLYLQGFKDCISLYKRLDGSFGESQDFGNVFV